MKAKKILFMGNMAILSILALAFSACDGTNGDAEFSSANGDSITKCDSTTDIPNGYTTLEAKDTIAKDTVDTKIVIYHSSSGDKKICVESGSARIIKG